MSYTTKRKNGRRGLGDLTDILGAGANAINDPCIGQVTALLTELHDLQPPSTPGAAPGPGVGLCSAVTPLQLFVATQKSPWILPVAAIGIVGGLIGIGWMLGEDSGRRRRGGGTP